jgi:hypothetical protein
MDLSNSVKRLRGALIKESAAMFNLNCIRYRLALNRSLPGFSE